MKSLNEIFNKRDAMERVAQAQHNLRSERDEQIAKFYDRKCIKMYKGKPKKLALLDKKELALLLRHCPTEDLFPFYQQCDRARDFSRFFWWSVKRKTPPSH